MLPEKKLNYGVALATESKMNDQQLENWRSEATWGAQSQIATNGEGWCEYHSSQETTDDIRTADMIVWDEKYSKPEKDQERPHQLIKEILERAVKRGDQG